MGEPAPELNGAAHPQEGAIITIVLRLTPTPNGYALAVNVDPATVYPDTVIEACQRAIRTFERTLDAQAVVQMLQGAQSQAIRLNREQERIRRIIQ